MIHLLPAFLTPAHIFFYVILLLISYYLFVKKSSKTTEESPKHVVIIGGGFAGVAATLRLRKKLYGTPIKITLINKHTYHLFTPSLYEVATSEEPRKNVAIPLSKIFTNGVEFIHDIVKKIDPTTNTLTLESNETLTYDYLLIAAGSQPAFMDIPGLEKYGTSFKTLHDALSIKKKIRNLCCKDGKCNRKVQAVIGGGGFAGTELAAELLTYKDRIAVQNGLDMNCLELTIIQGSDKLLKELDPHVSKIGEKRLSQPNVHFAFGGHIKEVTKTHVLTDNGKSFPYEILIWTGGVKPNTLAKINNLPITHRGGLIVNNYMQVKGFDNIFAAGDITAYIDPKTQNSAPNVAQIAEEQGQIAGENIAAMIKNESIKPYHYRHWGYIVPLKGYYAVAELVYNIHLVGFSGWIVQQLVLLRYLFSIMPWIRAIERFDTFELEMEK
ncbi:MAG TPA: NAD(P)/FAD-dependent oxidoreductase [Candidatus Sulfotelmatobacter sp.]|nr:NAD(P)/FAD-dependent oxidoreductase [Candidatus Sulfotelmatobacter sp.]